jgi:Na+/proline symporter
MLEVSDLTATSKLILGFVLVVFVGALAIVGRIAGRAVESESEYLVADRQVPLLLSVLALLATWFGSSAVIESSSKMYQGGLSEVLLDPISCGATLIVTGLFFARRFWNSGAATLADLFRMQFGPSAERLSCAIQVPSFFLWIGSQFLAMGQLLESTLDLPLGLAILVSALATLGIVLWGGMWAVTWANAIMIVVSIASVLVLFGATSWTIGDGDPMAGIDRVIRSAPEGHLTIDASTPSKLIGVLSILVIGLFGNVPGQDIQQRVASARSAATACWMCIIAGVLYLLFGMIPLYLGLAARWSFGERLKDGDLPLSQVASVYLSQPLEILLIVGMFSLCLAVAAGATLGQASIVSRNLLKSYFPQKLGTMWLARLSVALVIVGSVLVAYSGESIMELLELSLVIVLVSLFVPMVIALFFPTGSPRPSVGIGSMLGGFIAWLVGMSLEPTTQIPASLAGLTASALLGGWFHRARRG